MTKITWKGEAEGPPSCTWNGIIFPVGVAVEVADQWMINKALGNRFFTVVEERAGAFVEPLPMPAPAPPEPLPTQWREPATEADPADVSFYDDPPPSSNFADVLPNREPLKRKRGRPPKVRANGE